MMIWVRMLPDPLLLLVMISVGTLFWLFVAAMFVLHSKLKNSTVAKYAELKRENTRLKKYISGMRKEKISGRV